MAMPGLRHFTWIAILCVIAGFCCRKDIDSTRPCLDQVEVFSSEDSQDPVSPVFEGEKRSLSKMLRATLEGALAECKASARSRLSAKFAIARRMVLETGTQSLRAKGSLKITLKGERSGFGYFEENAETIGTSSVDSENGEKALIVAQKLTSALMGDLAKGYLDRLSLWSVSSTQLHLRLVEGALESRLEAIEVAGARGLRSEIPTLLKFLTDEDERLRDTALGALLLLRAREAVPILTKSREMKDGREMQKILDAIARLGGEEALAYLSFVAETHDNEQIRDLAKKALARLGALNRTSPTQ